MRWAGMMVLAASLGCATAPARSEHVLTGVARPAYAGPVRIFMEGAAASGGYEEVAIVSATGAGGNATLNAVLGALQREAASLGCDSVIHVRYEQGLQIASATGVAVRTQ